MKYLNNRNRFGFILKIFPILLLTLLLTACSADNRLIRYSPTANASENVLLLSSPQGTLIESEGHSPIQNSPSGLNTTLESPAISKRLFYGSDKTIAYGGYLYSASSEAGINHFFRTDMQTGKTVSLCPLPDCIGGSGCVFGDKYLLCFAIAGDEKSPLLFYAVGSHIEYHQKEVSLSDNTWSSALYCYDMESGKNYTIIENCPAIHRIFDFAIVQNRILLDASIYALNTESGAITTCGALLEVSLAGGAIDVLLVNGDNIYLDAFFQQGDNISAVAFRYDPEGVGSDRVEEYLLTVETDSNDISVSALPTALCGIPYRQKLGNKVFICKNGIYSLPISDLNTEPVLISDKVSEWQFATDHAVYFYEFITKIEENITSTTLDYRKFYRIDESGQTTCIFEEERIRITETIIEKDGFLYCRAHEKEAVNTSFYLKIDLKTGAYQILR